MDDRRHGSRTNHACRDNTVNGTERRPGALDFVLLLGYTATIDCYKCKFFPLNRAELAVLRRKLNGVRSVAVYNAARIPPKCWAKILGMRDVYNLLKEDPVREITIFNPPLLVFVVLETLGARYRLSTTQDGAPRRIETPA